jgi:hypothetical protein
MTDLSVTPQDDGWIDQDGTFWESLRDWFFIGILGGCACGTGEVPTLAIELLDYFAKEHVDRGSNPVYSDRAAEAIAHWFDAKDLIEHGSGIAGSWLSDRGRAVHSLLHQETP